MAGEKGWWPVRYLLPTLSKQVIKHNSYKAKEKEGSWGNEINSTGQRGLKWIGDANSRMLIQYYSLGSSKLAVQSSGAKRRSVKHTKRTGKMKNRELQVSQTIKKRWYATWLEKGLISLSPSPRSVQKFQILRINKQLKQCSWNFQLPLFTKYMPTLMC